MLLIIISLLAGGMLFVAFAPLTVTAEFTVSGAGHNGVIRLQWLHPLLARCRYDIGQRLVEVTIMGWGHTFPKKNAPATQPATTQAGNRDVPAKPAADAPLARGVDSGRGAEPVGEKRKKLHMQRGITGGNTPGGNAGGWQRVKTFFSISTDYRVTAKTLRWSMRTLRACFSVVRFRRFRLHAKAGAREPAETGKLYGWYTALDRSCFCKHRNIDVRFAPEFSGAVFECSGAITVRSSLARVGMPFVVAVMTFPYLTAYFVWRRLKKKRWRD